MDLGKDEGSEGSCPYCNEGACPHCDHDCTICEQAGFLCRVEAAAKAFYDPGLAEKIDRWLEKRKAGQAQTHGPLRAAKRRSF